MPDTLTYADKLEAIKREISYRKRVYPTRIANPRMTHWLADRQIALMEAIAEDFERAAAGERLF